MAKRQMQDTYTINHQIKNIIKKVDTGWINRSDWTNVHLGNAEVDYDNLSGTFIVGETITETGGNTATGVIMSDDGSTLVLRNVTNTGIFTNNNVITGSISGATADVNEPAGNNKDQDSNLFHNLSDNLSRFIVKVFYSTDGTDATSGEVRGSEVSATSYGYGITQVDTNNFIIQTAVSGLVYLSVGGFFNALDIQDWYYKIVAYRIAL